MTIHTVPTANIATKHVLTKEEALRAKYRMAYKRTAGIWIVVMAYIITYFLNMRYNFYSRFRATPALTMGNENTEGDDFLGNARTAHRPIYNEADQYSVHSHSKISQSQVLDEIIRIQQQSTTEDGLSNRTIRFQKLIQATHLNGPNINSLLPMLLQPYGSAADAELIWARKLTIDMIPFKNLTAYDIHNTLNDKEVLELLSYAQSITKKQSTNVLMPKLNLDSSTDRIQLIIELIRLNTYIYMGAATVVI